MPELETSVCTRVASLPWRLATQRDANRPLAASAVFREITEAAAPTGRPVDEAGCRARRAATMSWGPQM